jgi:hypothetical protein
MTASTPLEPRLNHSCQHVTIEATSTHLEHLNVKEESCRSCVMTNPPAPERDGLLKVKRPEAK